MAEATKPDLIWNRACNVGLNFLLRGDRALAAMIVFHSAAMNGGVLHALECITPRDIAAAEEGYRFFDLNNVAELLNEFKSGPKDDCDLDAWESELDGRYGQLVRDDSVLFESFKRALESKPSDFAPV